MGHLGVVRFFFVAEVDDGGATSTVAGASLLEDD